MKRLVLAIAFGATLVGCGGSNPAAPTQVVATPPPAVSIAGTWTGTFHAHQVNSSGSAFPWTEGIRVTLTQTGANVSGTWSLTGNNTADRHGTVSGTVNASVYEGTFTYSAKSATGSRCRGTITLSGATSASSIRWTSPGVVENCSNPPTGITIEATK
jgi:hypothetical protein